MNIQSYTVLHYGTDYLSYALRSVYDHVDKLHVIYTPTPSHGTMTDAAPPDSRDELRAAAYAYNPDYKIFWHDTANITDEGKQRNMAVGICEQHGADMVLVVDYDEVWSANTLRAALDYAWQQNSARDWLINFSHFWRSFDYACKDNNWPVRIIDLRHAPNTGVGYIPAELGDIYHFGYATTNKVMEYKWQIHGHKAEMRPDWWNKWDAWPPAQDCHPTNDNNWWMPEPFDKSKLPELMRQHPFYEMDRIE